MVDSGEYLWACLKYVELNMVRNGVVRHPREWPWSGFGELMGWRRRNRLLDIKRLLELLRASSVDNFRAHLNCALEEAIAKAQLKREDKWTNSLAVGSRAFIEDLESRMRNRQVTDCCEQDGSWVLREERGEGMARFPGQKPGPNSPQAPFTSSNLGWCNAFLWSDHGAL
jgi:putative transposase